jgi:hypothetical protein
MTLANEFAIISLHGQSDSANLILLPQIGVRTRDSFEDEDRSSWWLFCWIKVAGLSLSHNLHAIIVTTVYRLGSVSGEHHFLEGGACWVERCVIQPALALFFLLDVS